MKLPAPAFHIARVFDDGSRELEIVPVTQAPVDIVTHRRGFFGAGLTAAGVLAATGCASSTPMSPKARTGRTGAPTTASDCHENTGPPTFKSEGECAGLVAHGQPMRTLRWSADGLQLFSQDAGGTIKWWSTPGGALLGTARDSGAQATNLLAVSADGRVIATSLFAGVRVRLPDLQASATFDEIPPLTSIALSPDGHVLASAQYLGIKLWNIADRVLIRKIESPGVVALAMAAQGRILVSGHGDGSIRLWGNPDGVLVQTLPRTPDADGLRELVTSADGRTLVSGYQSCLRVWSLPEGTKHRTLGYLNRGARGVAVTADGSKIAAGGVGEGGGEVRVWDLANGSVQAVLHKGVRDVALSPDGRFLASAGDDKSIRVWRLADSVFERCLIDLADSPSTSKGLTYQWRNEYGQLLTFTLPCGSPIPAGAVCTCNCVPGSIAPSAPPAVVPRPGGKICTCVPVCVCMAVPVCHALHLLDDDPVARTLARELILQMGKRELPYLRWVLGVAGGSLSPAVAAMISDVLGGVQSNPARWPRLAQCLARLGSGDEVVAVMAAQMARQRQIAFGEVVDRDLVAHISALIGDAIRRPWFVRQGLDRSSDRPELRSDLAAFSCRVREPVLRAAAGLHG